nr:MAG TPA: hypothetical protein [Caudoviricetes sp.]
MPVICLLTYSISHCRCQIHSAPYAFPTFYFGETLAIEVTLDVIVSGAGGDQTLVHTTDS